MGRKLLWPEKMVAAFPEGTLARIDAVREDGEDRTDVIRTAVERELKRRRPTAIRRLVEKGLVEKG